MNTIKLLLTSFLLLFVTASFGQSAQVQAIHNSPDASLDTVDVWANLPTGPLKLVDDFTFRSASQFLSAPAGSAIQIGLAPSNSQSIGDTLVRFEFTPMSGQEYIAVVNDTLGDLKLNLETNAQQSSSGSSSTALLAHHGSTDAPNVDIEAGGSPLFTNLAYSSFQGYNTVPTADAIVTVKGSNSGNVVGKYEANLNTLGLGGAAITVFASGFLDPSTASNVDSSFGLYAATPGGSVVKLPQVQDTASVQIIHNSPDNNASTVDVWVNGSKGVDDLDFREATGFVDITYAAGTQVDIGVAGPNSTSPSDIITSFQQQLTGGQKYVAVVNDTLGDLKLNVQDSARVAASGGSGNTDLLAHHGSTDAPNVDIEAGGSPLITNLAYTNFQGYTPVPAADAVVTVKGTNSGNIVGKYEANLNTLGLGGSAITVFASGFLDPSTASNVDSSFGLYAATPGGSVVKLPQVQDTASVQVIHNSPDNNASTVDVWVNGSKAVDDLGFREATGFVDITYAAGTQLDIGVAGPNSSAVSDIIKTFQPSVSAGGKYVAVVNGTVQGNTSLTLDVKAMARENASGGSGNTDILAHHGSPDAPNVDIEVAGNSFTNLAYKAFDGYLGIGTANATVTVKNNNDGSVIGEYKANLSDWNLGGTAITVVASGYADPSTDAAVDSTFGLYAATPSGGSMQKLPMVTSVGPKISSDNSFDIYPNPVVDQLRINWQQTTGANVAFEMYNQVGQVVKSEELTRQGNSQIDLAKQADGIYLIRLYQDGEVIGSEKVMKQ